MSIASIRNANAAERQDLQSHHADVIALARSCETAHEVRQPEAVVAACIAHLVQAAAVAANHTDVTPRIRTAANDIASSRRLVQAAAVAANHTDVTPRIRTAANDIASSRRQVQ